MGLGAVVVVGASDSGWSHEGSAYGVRSSNSPAFFAGMPACLEVCGRSTVERIVERLKTADVEAISVLAQPGISLPVFRAIHDNVTVEFVNDLDSALSEKIFDYAQRGVQHAFINWAGTYVETDLLDLFCFHRESRQSVTPTYDQEGSLDLWVVDCAKAQDATLEHLLSHSRRGGLSRYFIREYVNRVNHPSSIRKFACDMLRGRCQTGPSGREARPGVWLDEGAEIHRRARLVAPLYVGRGSKVRADALVTRFSDIETDCVVDCGTVVEDTSVLAKTSIGIWLDLCHAVVSGNLLLNLERDVLIEITDPSVLHSTSSVRNFIPSLNEPAVAPEKVSKTKEPRMPEGWQLGTNLIQE